MVHTAATSAAVDGGEASNRASRASRTSAMDKGANLGRHFEELSGSGAHAPMQPSAFCSKMAGFVVEASLMQSPWSTVSALVPIDHITEMA